MMKKEIRICDNCEKKLEDYLCYDAGWIFFDGINSRFRIINQTNKEKTQGRAFEGKNLDFCCIDCLHKYFDNICNARTESKIGGVWINLTSYENQEGLSKIAEGIHNLNMIIQTWLGREIKRIEL